MIIFRAISKLNDPANAQKRDAYQFEQVLTIEHRSSSGKPERKKEKTYFVKMQNGWPERHLLRMDGKQVSAEDFAKESARERRIRDRYIRSGKSSHEKQEQVLSVDLARRFDFTLLHTEQSSTRPIYKIAFRPKTPALEQKHVADRVLQRMNGTLWIDGQDFEIQKVEATLSEPVKLLGGLIGALNQMEFHLERIRLNNGAWFNQRSTVRISGRKLLETVNLKISETSDKFSEIQSSVIEERQGEERSPSYF